MLKKLFIIQLQSAYKSIFLRGNSKRKQASGSKAALIGLLVLFVGGSLLFSVGSIFYELAQALISASLGWYYFAMAGIIAFMMSVIFTVFVSQSMLFEAKDNQLLLSLPIKPASILGSRLLVLATLEFISNLIFLLPAGIIYAYLANPPVLFYVAFLITAILLPLLGLTVAALFGYIISAVTSRMRNKSLFVTFFSLVLLALYFWGYTSLTTGTVNLIANGAAIGETIKNALPPFYHFGMALSNINIVSLLWFALWCLLPFGLMVLWLSRQFIALATTSRQTKKLTYKESKVASSSVFAALLKKEINKFVNTPMYLLNCGISYLFNIALGVYFFIEGPNIISTLSASIPGASAYVVPAVVAALSFLASMSYTTAPSISLEGKNLWILRSSPIKVKDIFNAKISLNVIFGFSTLIFADILIIFKLAPTPVEALLIVLIPLSVQLFTAIGGLICNLFFPKFDAVNETVVVKQSASVFVTMLISFGLMAVLIISYILLAPAQIPFILFGLGAFVFIMILNILAYRFTLTKGVKMFNHF